MNQFNHPHGQQIHGQDMPPPPYMPPYVPDRLVWRPLPPEPPQIRAPLPARGSGISALKLFAVLVALAMLVLAVVLVLVFRNHIGTCLSLVGEVGSNDPRAQAKGLAVMGVVLVSLLAALRIVVTSLNKSERRD